AHDGRCDHLNSHSRWADVKQDRGVLVRPPFCEGAIAWSRDTGEGNRLPHRRPMACMVSGRRSKIAFEFTVNRRRRWHGSRRKPEVIVLSFATEKGNGTRIAFGCNPIDCRQPRGSASLL